MYPMSQKECQSFDLRLKSQSWLNYRKLLDLLLRSQDTEQSRTLHGFLRAEDYTGLVSFADSIASQKYETAEQHFSANQLAAFIRKYPFPKGSVDSDPRAKALETFLAAENRCRRMNQKFAILSKGRNPYTHELNSARAWIRYVLGDFSFAHIVSSCNWGPGAAVGVHGNATNMARKLLSQSWSVSPCAYDIARSFLKADPLIFEYLCAHDERYHAVDPDLFDKKCLEKSEFVDYNKIAFVPKTALVERTIAIEPSLNGFVQKGADLYMRSRLKRVGLDLHDQSRNQELARLGSLKDEIDPFVTIDLSSASDSISIGLCRDLLPPEWFYFLNRIRSRSYLIKGRQPATYEKFTSMGNGFCFPLETLLFGSLCAVAYDEQSLSHDFCVYGDDIIVRQSASARVLSLLRNCGFKANRRKTFLQGPFRESCGADWFEGEDVRPLTLDYAFDSIQSIFKFCNLANSKDLTRSFFAPIRGFLVSLLPPRALFVRPYKGVVDSALEVSLDVFMTSPFSKWDSNIFSWSWIEIMSTGVGDLSIHRHSSYGVALMRGALSGSVSTMPFAERRKTRTKVRRVAYSGATSTWLPRSAS